MTAIKATIKDGRLEIDAPADWPDGIEVEIRPVEPLSDNSEDDRLSPDEIARTLAAMDRVEPLEMSDAEWAAWEAERRTRRELDKLQFLDRATELGKQWP